ncbi:MAG: DegT/DnrJ/EryC1/StrS family aminotransferase [SAR324 cluster bacterium]|nr:DegT/DnrJ/EryC1/StrS family aminotransferase [SAR324 cluster bacterium]
MILMNDFKAESKFLKEEMLAAVSRVIDSGWYVLGREVEAFERGWAEVCGVSHTVGVGNGMDAIEIILRSLQIGPGDEVITTPMTAFATFLGIMRAGAIPVLADIDPETALLDRDSVVRCISPKTKAIILVHLYGQVRDMDAWLQFCESEDIYLIEDCAQSHLATWHGRVAGSFGKAGAYSFYPTKNLGGLGDGGAVITDDENLAEKAKQLRNYGQSTRYHHPEIGMNSRLDEIQAALLSERLKWLEKFNDRRRQIAQRYFEEIKNPLIQHLAKPQEQSAHVYHLFVLTCPWRDQLIEHLQQSKIQTLIHYPIPIHLQRSSQSLKRDPAGLVSSETHAETCLSIPCHPQMNDDDIEVVINAVNRFQV